jgi:hypothetical protein
VHPDSLIAEFQSTLRPSYYTGGSIGELKRWLDCISFIQIIRFSADQKGRLAGQQLLFVSHTVKRYLQHSFCTLGSPNKSMRSLSENALWSDRSLSAYSSSKHETTGDFVTLERPEPNRMCFEGGASGNGWVVRVLLVMVLLVLVIA